MDYHDGWFYALWKNNEYSWMEFILELRAMKSKVDLHYLWKIEPFKNLLWMSHELMLMSWTWLQIKRFLDVQHDNLCWTKTHNYLQLFLFMWGNLTPWWNTISIINELWRNKRDNLTLLLWKSIKVYYGWFIDKDAQDMWTCLGGVV
jgi:hypothetical protein